MFWGPTRWAPEPQWPFKWKKKQKSNTDTKNGPYFKAGITFSKAHNFGALQPLVFGGVTGVITLPVRVTISPLAELARWTPPKMPGRNELFKVNMFRRHLGF